MLFKISNFFVRLTRGWLILILLGIILFINLVLLPQSITSVKSMNNGPLDLLFFYTPQKAFQMIDSYGEAGRDAYRTFALTIDVLYPLIYTLFFCLFISFLFQRGEVKLNRLQRLNVIPLGAGFFDLLENLSIVAMLSVYPEQSVFLAWLATTFTMLKWIFVGLSFFLISVGISLIIKRKYFPTKS